MKPDDACNRDMADGDISLSEYIAVYESVPSAYYEWMFSRISASLESPVLEIGSGPGIITQLLLDHGLDVTGVDIDPVVVRGLSDRYRGNTHLHVALADVTRDSLDALPGAPFSSIVCLNTLEHFQDDNATLRSFHRVLKPGGRLAILVPAHPWLYGSMDEMFGHVKRYRRRELQDVLVAAQFRPRLEWFNPVGIPGWWWRFCVQKKRTFSRGQTAIYRRLLPLLRAAESHVAMPIGLSLIAIADKVAEERR